MRPLALALFSPAHLSSTSARLGHGAGGSARVAGELGFTGGTASAQRTVAELSRVTAQDLTVREERAR